MNRSFRKISIEIRLWKIPPKPQNRSGAAKNGASGLLEPSHSEHQDRQRLGLETCGVAKENTGCEGCGICVVHNQRCSLSDFSTIE